MKFVDQAHAKMIKFKLNASDKPENIQGAEEVFPCVFWTAEIFDPNDGPCNGLTLIHDFSLNPAINMDVNWTKNKEWPLY